MREENGITSEDQGKAGDKVVVEPEIKSSVPGVQGGMLLAGRGKVVSVEANVKTVKPGDIVAFDQTAGQEVLIFGKILKILKESEITPAQEL